MKNLTISRAVLGAVVLLVVTADALVAQAAKTNHIIGWVSSPTLPASGGLQIQDLDNKCQAAKRLCTGGVLLNTTLVEAGGLAYNPSRQSVWVSDGPRMEEWSVLSCKKICTVKPSIMRKGAVVGGLAISSRRGMLYHLETTPGYLGILPWNNTKCPPVPTKGGCFLTLGKGEFGAGLAYDEARDVLYYTVSTPVGTSMLNTLHVARPTNACKSVCSYKLPSCPAGSSKLAGAVTGLAYDDHKQRLHITDGTTTMTLAVADPLKCGFKVLGCCAKQTGGGVYQGLAALPGWTQTRLGKNCITKGCPYCSKLDIRLYGGDPAAGNKSFGVMVENGPVGATGVLGIGLGDCGTANPFFCGQLYFDFSVPFLVLVPGKLTGSQCLASLRQPLPVPNNIAVVGSSLCMQWLVTCSSVSGGLTPALQVRIQNR